MSSELQQLMAEFEPDADSFYRAACQIPVDADLDRIAGADYGDPETSLAALRRICRGEPVSVELLSEVAWDCSIIRWSAPKVYLAGPRELTPDECSWHRRRLLSCAVLLRLIVLDYSELGIGDLAAIAMADCLRFQPSLLAPLRRLLAAIAIGTTTEEDQIPTIMMACIAVALAEHPCAVRSEHLARTAEAACRRFEQVTDKWNDESEPAVELYYYGIYHDLWRSLANHFLLEPQRPHPPEADAALRRLGRLILRGVSF